MKSLQESITIQKQSSFIEDLKKIDASEETVRKIEQSLENNAKARMEAIQGQYYETYHQIDNLLKVPKKSDSKQKTARLIRLSRFYFICL